MLQAIKKYIQKMCADTPATYGSALEAYIVSKQPKDAADVDYWTRQFEYQQRQHYTNFTAGGYHGR